MARKWNPDEVADLEDVLVAEGQCVEVFTYPNDSERRMMVGRVRSTHEYFGDGETER